MFLVAPYIPSYPNIKIVDKHGKRQYSSFCTNKGIVLCDKQEGSFLVLRYKEDLERLKDLLNSIEIKE